MVRGFKSILQNTRDNIVIYMVIPDTIILLRSTKGTNFYLNHEDNSVDKNETPI